MQSVLRAVPKAQYVIDISIPVSDVLSEGELNIEDLSLQQIHEKITHEGAQWGADRNSNILRELKKFAVEDTEVGGEAYPQERFEFFNDSGVVDIYLQNLLDSVLDSSLEGDLRQKFSGTIVHLD